MKISEVASRTEMCPCTEGAAAAFDFSTTKIAKGQGKDDRPGSDGTVSIRSGKVQDLMSTQLHDRMLSILTPSYIDPKPLFNREIQHCDRIYLAEDNHNELVSFFLVAFQNEAAPDEIYLGLSATSQSTKNSGTVRVLYSQCADDIRERETKRGAPFVIWSTTASPSAFHGGRLFWDCEPDARGTASQDAREAAARIQKRIVTSTRSENPFVLRGVADPVRYSELERRRIGEIVTKTGFDLFNRLSIDEARGDRLLVIAHTKLLPELLRGGQKLRTARESLSVSMNSTPFRRR
jgi:hypothetical protein